MKKQLTKEERYIKEIDKLKFLYIKGSPQAVKFARRQLVNTFGFDDDYITGQDDDGQYHRGENFKG